MFSPQNDAAIKAHALEAFPREACGLITADGYLRCTNVATDAGEFKIDPAEYLAAGKILAVAHSHVNEQAAPSAADMRGQIDTAVPWGIVATDGANCTEVVWWGDGVPVPPLVERPFRHGPSGSDGRGDCFAIIKDSALLAWDVKLPEFPRDDEWWAKGGDLYREGFSAAGYRRLGRDERPEPGDVFLAQIRSKVPNHGGVLLAGNLILHHLHLQLSRREPVPRWSQKLVTHWLRLEARPCKPFVIP